MRRLLFVLALVAALTLPGPASAAPASPAGEAAPAPPAEVAALTGVQSLTTGLEHSCALMQNAQVRCWGSSNYGMLGNGEFGSSPTPVVVVAVNGPGPLTGVAQVSAGYNHTCALLTNHQVRCWGFNESGQLATNTGYMSYARPQVALNPAGTGPLRNVIAIDIGGDTSCALMSNHQVRCWGANGDGQAGVGTTNNPQLPRTVLNPAGNGPLTGVAHISVGRDMTCALLNTGQARCWGHNDKGQTGDGTNRPKRTRPRVVRRVAGPGALTGIRQISAGEGTTCALLNTGQVRCWGLNADGGLGDGTLVNHNRPVRVLNSPGHPLIRGTRVEAGYAGACARLRTGRVRCWGNGTRGQMGDGDIVEDNPVPAYVENHGGVEPLTGIADLSYASAHGCVRMTTSQVRCWGLGVSGQLGDGNSVDSPFTVTVVA